MKKLLLLVLCVLPGVAFGLDEAVAAPINHIRQLPHGSKLQYLQDYCWRHNSEALKVPLFADLNFTIDQCLRLKQVSATEGCDKQAIIKKAEAGSEFPEAFHDMKLVARQILEKNKHLLGDHCQKDEDFQRVVRIEHRALLVYLLSQPTSK